MHYICEHIEWRIISNNLTQLKGTPLKLPVVAQDLWSVYKISVVREREMDFGDLRCGRFMDRRWICNYVPKVSISIEVTFFMNSLKSYYLR